LHASTVALGSEAIAVAGASGAGKSTTVTALSARGYRLVSDDVTVLSLRPTGEYQIVPGNPLTYLAEDSAQGLGYAPDRLQFRAWRRMKASISAPTVPGNFSAPLAALFVLSNSAEPEVKLTALSGVDKFAALLGVRYLPVDPQTADQELDRLRAVAERIQIFSVARPIDRWSVDQIAEALVCAGRAYRSEGELHSIVVEN
jgi:hypothetical protein